MAAGVSVLMARHGSGLACLARPQALAAWRHDSPHLCSTRCLAAARVLELPSAHALTLCVLPCMQASVQQGELKYA